MKARSSPPMLFNRSTQPFTREDVGGARLPPSFSTTLSPGRTGAPSVESGAPDKFPQRGNGTQPNRCRRPPDRGRPWEAKGVMGSATESVGGIHWLKRVFYLRLPPSSPQPFISVSPRDSPLWSKSWVRNYLFRAWLGLTESSSAETDIATVSMTPRPHGMRCRKRRRSGRRSIWARALERSVWPSFGHSARERS